MITSMTSPHAIPFAPKNPMLPQIHKDFFTEEEIERIKGIIAECKNTNTDDEIYKPLVLQKMSRQQIEIPYPEDIVLKLEKFASELCGEDVVLNHNSYLDYDQKYNPGTNPSLPPHFDSDNYYTKVTLDYQLDKTFDWAVIIEGKKFVLEIGDMLSFWGAGQAHWRENITLQPGEKTEVLTFHFSKAEDHELLDAASRKQEARESRLEETKKIIEQYRRLYTLEEQIFKKKNEKKE
jgi:hypothetical protein